MKQKVCATREWENIGSITEPDSDLCMRNRRDSDSELSTAPRSFQPNVAAVIDIWTDLSAQKSHKRNPRG